MILTCPECASRYFVDDSKVGPSGRTVRCASCGARWTARNEDDLDLFEEPSAADLAAAEVLAKLEAQNAADDPETPVDQLPGEELPKVFRARADAERRLKEAKTTGIIWGGMVAVMVLLLVAAGVFRMNVAHLWPSTAGAYAFARMPVNNVGLVVEDLKAEPSMQNGHAAITITGVIRNITDHPVSTPPLRVALLNKHEKRVAGQLAAAADPLIPPSQTRHFAVTLLDPPRTANTLEIGFALEPGAAKHAGPAGHVEKVSNPEAPSLRGAQDQPAELAAGGQPSVDDAQGAGHEPPGHETGTVEPAPADHH
ncbi:MJ0042-type zinc finger domain-containing protein [Caulobacter sp. UNC358MFTsu5.1]|uniref:MJ0042-type zinc finger domain-containing protein n=1 Tax=Caulobacter sp. UNC358MFTsu5.1 TaxID=1449049 RepID=UPI0004A7506F|nr:MJ0042-type zinc finger domain-containing protein [Caulobacter sp. UNC358MFTsu5.1]